MFIRIYLWKVEYLLKNTDSHNVIWWEIAKLSYRHFFVSLTIEPEEKTNWKIICFYFFCVLSFRVPYNADNEKPSKKGNATN